MDESNLALKNATAANESKLNKTKKQNQAKVNKLNTDIDNLKSELTAISNKATTLKTQVDNLKKENAKLKKIKQLLK